ncbi:cytidine deaminase [Myxococcota bacterium]|nr:cytidine deaminase [Myxococcota bacterium]
MARESAARPIHPGTPRESIPRKLLEAARDAASHAYAPYSRFAVGAAVETLDGRIFSSANMENASYGLTLCAEAGAIQAASFAGALGEIRRIAVVGGPLQPPPGYTSKPTAPCGRCRQLMAEGASHGNHDIEVWFADLELGRIERRMCSELLPESFGASNLG